MWSESSEPQKGKKPPELKTGLTTGACATACSVAGAIYLLEQGSPAVVSITLPNNKPATRKSKTVELSINEYLKTDRGIRVSTTKNAGDDPDVTHGATVYVELALTANEGIEFKATKGVGTVTREGLLLDVGEPAINPVPRKMIKEHLEALAGKNNYSGGFLVAIGIENGEIIAQKTMNPRLGILGGLSILGTTGIAATTGNTSE